MKRFIPALALIVLASCSPFGFNPEGYEVLSEPLEVAWPKAAALQYIPDIDADDYWKSPHETLRDGGGDCEDIAAYLIYLLGPESCAVGIKNGDTNHCIVKYRGKYIDPSWLNWYYSEDEITIITMISYDEVMRISTHSGTCSVEFNY